MMRRVNIVQFFLNDAMHSVNSAIEKLFLQIEDTQNFQANAVNYLIQIKTIHTYCNVVPFCYQYAPSYSSICNVLNLTFAR